MKAIWNNNVIGESDNTVLAEGNLCFPESSLNKAVVTLTNHKSSCHWKGQAS